MCLDAKADPAGVGMDLFGSSATIADVNTRLKNGFTGRA
jgi:hypothetical protein